MLVDIVFTKRLSAIRIQSVTVFTNFTYLWRGYSEGQRSRSSKNEGQCHKNTKIAFLHNFYGKSFDPWCLFGVMSQFKGQRSRSLEGQIWCYSFLSLIIKHFWYVLALLNVGVTFRLTTILSDFDKMTCLCMGGT